ncbi:MAG: hypothetical protein PUE88_05040 [Ruminococcus sp.]|nr:hypothetical protein [Ruminococcus sp.]
MIRLYLNLTVSKNAIAAGKTDCKIEFASQMWATRPHLASIFEKLLEQKTFYLPAAWNWKLFIFSSVFRQLFTKSRICAKMKTIEKNRRQKT